MDKLQQYKTIKEQMKTGDLLQWHHHSAIGYAIQTATHSKWNHSSLIIRLAEFEGLERRRFTTEALRQGTVLNLLSRRLKNFNGEVWWYPLIDDWNEKRQAVGERALELIGVPYDFKTVVSMLFEVLPADIKKLFCSEYCYVAWGFSGPAPSPAGLLDLGIFKEGMQIL